MSNGAPTRPATVADVLDAAADLLTEDGRGVGINQDDNGRCCLVGALNQVLTGDPFDDGSDWEALWSLNRDARAALLDDIYSDWPTDEELLSTTGSALELLTQFNDSHMPQTDDPVIATLRRVAADHRATGQRPSAHTGGA